MKKWIALFFLTIPSLCLADSYTNKLGLTIPTIGSPNWGQKINGDMQIIDAAYGNIIPGTTYYALVNSTNPQTGSINLTSGTFRTQLQSLGPLIVGSIGSTASPYLYLMPNNGSMFLNGGTSGTSSIWLRRGGSNEARFGGNGVGGCYTIDVSTPGFSSTIVSPPHRIMINQITPDLWLNPGNAGIDLDVSSMSFVLPDPTQTGINVTHSGMDWKTLGRIRFSTGVIAPAFYGDGSNLTGLPASGSSIYPATSTIVAPYGISASTINVSTFTAYLSNVTGSLGIHQTSPAGLLHIGENQPIANQNTSVILASSKTLASGNGHGFGDYTIFNSDNGSAYASYDGKMASTGTSNYDHLVSFQSSHSHASPGTLVNLYDFVGASGNSGGTVTNRKSLYIEDAGGSGVIGTQIGIWIDQLSRGSSNWAIYSYGNSPSYLGGLLLLPAQPSFEVYASGTLSNVTGDGTAYTIPWNTEVFDQANNFTSNTFTAPITGRYHFDAGCYVSGLTTSNTDGHLNLVTTKRTIYLGEFTKGTVAITEWQLGKGVTTDMDVNDTAYVTMTVNGTGKTVDIIGGASLFTYFSGSLVQ